MPADRLRKPFLVVSVLLALLIVLIEVASNFYVGASSDQLPTPGLGIPYLALVDGIVLYTIGLFGLSLIVPARILGAVHGIVTFFLALFLLIGCIVLIFIALAMLVMMVTLLLAVPFGTIVYFAEFSDFDVGPARVTLGILMLLKVGIAIFLFLAQQRFISVKGLVFLLLTSILANIIVSFLHGFLPVIFASILDAVAAIIVGVLAAVWALIKLIGAIPAAIKGLRFDRHLS